MKLIAALICVGGVWAGTALAQSPVTLTIDTRTPGAVISDDFVGLSFGMRALLADKNGGHFFSATNTPLITLFQNLGLSHLRVGGTTVESPPDTAIPGEPEIDSLFAFVRATGVKRVIYSLRLMETDPAKQYAVTNAALARYIWDHYQPWLECFALGNEPDLSRVYHQDWYITNFPSYLKRWQQFAVAITNAVPQAKFAGPDAGSGNIDWTTRFAKAGNKSGLVTMITEHFYAGGKGKGVEAKDGIETMLSPDWITNNQTLYNKMAAVVMSNGLPYRFTEANDHYSGGISNASDTFAGVLWALDFLHWWAAHDAKGVDFHNTQWVVSDILAPDESRQLKIKPKGYGLKAFDLGSHGQVTPLKISNPDGVNLNAYAVRDASNLFVTIINKDYGTNAREAEVTINLDGTAKRAEAIFLSVTNGDVTSKTGVTLGGASIGNDSPWLGKWTPLASDKSGECIVKVPAASAVVVKITMNTSINNYALDYNTPVDPALQAELEKLDSGLRARFDMTNQTPVGLLDLQTMRLALILPDQEDYAASVAKIGILLASFQLHPEAATNLDATVRHELGMMAKISSNEMASKYSQLIGLKEVQKVINSYDLYNTNHGGGIWVGKHYGAGTERITDPVGHNSHAITVRQVMRYFLWLEQGKLVSPQASEQMRKIFATPELPHDNIKFVKGLAGRDVQIIRKWGTWENWRHDSAVVTGPGRRYILVAMTNHPRGDDYLAALAPAVDDLMSHDAPAKKQAEAK